MADITFFIGGARSGKSRLAQSAAEAMDGRLVYIATAEALDEEMTDRIERHRADRGPRWRTVESPIDLSATIVREAVDGAVLVVDCLTLWLSNLVCGDHDVDAAVEALAEALDSVRVPVMLVGNEVGMAIVPENALARRFRDDAGRLNQRIAAAADEVFLVVAGLPMQLK